MKPDISSSGLTFVVKEFSCIDDASRLKISCLYQTCNHDLLILNSFGGGGICILGSNPIFYRIHQ
ncbi:MAG TPA: hypothetical protein VFR65_00450 [Nitrososphaeraceae archaeon]|nr:hypothetical protein [Nitrososphaeraceae archaeon]